MKIAISISEKSFDSKVDPRFGRCPYYVIVDSETDEHEIIKNTAGEEFRGAGVTAAQMIADKGVKVAISGNFGPKAMSVLNSAGIEAKSGVSDITAKEAYDKQKKGEL